MVERILEGVARSYPSKLIDDQLGDIPRIAFNIRLALNGADYGAVLKYPPPRLEQAV
jgi:hypothetical protein